MRLIAGLDVGTTGCKVTVFDEDGKRLGREYRDYPTKRGTGFEELDPHALAKAVKECVDAAIQTFGLFEAIGVTSFGESFVITDGEGIPLRPVMLCSDNRGHEECATLVAELGNEKLASITGIKPNETYSLPKLLWIKNHEPEVFAKAKYVMLIEDFVIFCLTGQRKIDYSLATRSMAFDFRTLTWSKEILDAVKIPSQMFSTPIPTGAIAGTTKDGVKVVAAGHDQVAAAVGSGIFEPGTAVDGAGTCECVTPVYQDIPQGTDFQNNNYNITPYFGKYVAYAYTYTGGVLAQWATELLGKSHKELESGDYKPTGLLVLPHFAGAATPYMDSGSKGAIIGVTLATTPHDLYCACLEGVVYEMRLNRERLAQSGVIYNRLIATGGGAKSRLWTQMKADILNLPVISLETEDAGTVGSAMLSGIAAGIFPSLPSACKTMVKEIGTFTPNPARTKEYDAIYAKYSKLYDSVRSLV